MVEGTKLMMPQCWGAPQPPASPGGLILSGSGAALTPGQAPGRGATALVL